MTIQDRLLGDGSLKATTAGFELAIRLPWYRSLPLSTIEPAALVVNGRTIDLAAARVRINGRSFTTAELAEQTGQVWFVLDPLTLEVGDAPVKPGDEIQVQFTLNVYPPYIPGMCWVSRVDRRLRAR